MKDKNINTIIGDHEISVPAHLMPSEVKIIDETEVMRTVVVNQRAYSVPVDVALACSAHDDLVRAAQAMHKLLDKDLVFFDKEVRIPFESHDQGWNHVHEARDIVKSALTKAGSA